MVGGNHVHRITTAEVGLTEDQNARVRRYLMSMSIRTVCFLGAIVAQGWLRWTLVVGAVLLPYLAVVAANAGRERSRQIPDSLMVPDDVRMLTSANPPVGTPEEPPAPVQPERPHE